jgi:hypothetical protein
MVSEVLFDQLLESASIGLGTTATGQSAIKAQACTQ